MKNYGYYFARTKKGTFKSKDKPFGAHADLLATPNEDQQDTEQAAPVDNDTNNNYTQTPASVPIQTEPILPYQYAQITKRKKKDAICRCSKAGEKCAAKAQCAFSHQINLRNEITTPSPSRQAELDRRQVEARDRIAHETDVTQARLRAQREQNERQSELVRVIEKAKKRRTSEEREREELATGREKQDIEQSLRKAEAAQGHEEKPAFRTKRAPSHDISQINPKEKSELSSSRQVVIDSCLTEERGDNVQETKVAEDRPELWYEQNETQLNSLRHVEKADEYSCNEEKEPERELEAEEPSILPKLLATEAEELEKERLAHEELVPMSPEAGTGARGPETVKLKATFTSKHAALALALVFSSLLYFMVPVCLHRL